MSFRTRQCCVQIPPFAFTNMSDLNFHSLSFYKCKLEITISTFGMTVKVSSTEYSSLNIWGIQQMESIAPRSTTTKALLSERFRMSKRIWSELCPPLQIRQQGYSWQGTRGEVGSVWVTWMNSPLLSAEMYSDMVD